MEGIKLSDEDFTEMVLKLKARIAKGDYKEEKITKNTGGFTRKKMSRLERGLLVVLLIMATILTTLIVTDQIGHSYNSYSGSKAVLIEYGILSHIDDTLYYYPVDEVLLEDEFKCLAKLSKHYEIVLIIPEEYIED